MRKSGPFAKSKATSANLPIKRLDRSLLPWKIATAQIVVVDRRLALTLDGLKRSGHAVAAMKGGAEDLMSIEDSAAGRPLESVQSRLPSIRMAHWAR